METGPIKWLVPDWTDQPGPVFKRCIYTKLHFSNCRCPAACAQDSILCWASGRLDSCSQGIDGKAETWASNRARPIIRAEESPYYDIVWILLLLIWIEANRAERGGTESTWQRMSKKKKIDTCGYDFNLFSTLFLSPLKYGLKLQFYCE